MSADRDKLNQYIYFKWFVIGVTAAAVLIELAVGITDPLNVLALFSMLAAFSLTSLTALFLAKRNISPRYLSGIMLSVDLSLTIIAMYLSGGPESTWNNYPVFFIFMAGYIFSLSAAMLTSAFSVGAMALMFMLEYLSVLPHFWVFASRNDYWKAPQYMIDYLIGLAILFFSGAVMSGVLNRIVQTNQVRTENSLRESESARLDLEKSRQALLSIMEDLDRGREDLEKKVKERTLELFEAKSGLEKKVMERTDDLESSRKAVLHMMKDLKEDMLRLQEVDTLKSDFVSTVSHELRTPLTVIKEGVNLVLEQVVGPTNAQQQECLTMVIRNIERLTKLISNVLDISKIEAGKMDLQKQKVDVKALLENLAASFGPVYVKKSLKLEVQVEDSPLAYADSDKIVEVLVNLVNNAYKFTEKGGVVISARKIKNFVEIGVRDTGAGIPPEELPRMFQKFAQVGDLYVRHSGGTGLGLYISRNLVEAMGGIIKVESKLGQGTKFTFTLPMFGEDGKEGMNGKEDTDSR